jgi:hypothetical protein
MVRNIGFGISLFAVVACCNLSAQGPAIPEVVTNYPKFAQDVSSAVSGATGSGGTTVIKYERAATADKTGAQGIDLDIDEDNKHGMADPDHNEELLEDASDWPGKALAINELDTDHDGVPDFADGYDITFGSASQSAANASRPFVPVILTIPDNITDSSATVTFDGPLSDPASDVSRSGGGTAASPYVYAITGGGKVRLWNMNGDQARKKAAIGPGTSAGNAVKKNTPIQVTDLGMNAQRQVHFYLEALAASSSLGDIVIKVTLNPGTTSQGSSDSIRATVFAIEAVHPIADDFHAPTTPPTTPPAAPATPDKVGAVLISTKQDTDKDTAYYTKKITTKAGKRAQSSDHHCVTISAYVTPVPPKNYPNLKVYFEVTDPDDLSHYEGKTVGAYGVLSNPDPTQQGDTNPNDNRDPNKQMLWPSSGAPSGYLTFQNKCLTARSSDVDAPVTINSTTRAVAETTLNITEQYSGDNYQVRATMQDPGADGATGAYFDTRSGMTAGSTVVSSSIKASETLIAWKRLYYEQDEMLTDDSSVTVLAIDVRNGVQYAAIDKGGLFRPGDQVVLMGQDGRFNTTVDTAGTVPPIMRAGNIIRQGYGFCNVICPAGVQAVTAYMGIQKLNAANDCTATDTSTLPKAYGSVPDGSDGGAFIEFQKIAEPANVAASTQRSESVPNYKAFQEHVALFGSNPLDFAQYWFDMRTEVANNVLQLLGMTTDPDQVWKEGVSFAGVYSSGHCIVFHQYCANNSGEVAGHEIGHRNDILKANSAHVDQDNNNWMAHDSSGNNAGQSCKMTYFQTTGEFCVPCLFALRDRADQ